MTKLYLSHPIRGAKGAAATDEDMVLNNERAINFANRLRNTMLNEYDELYVPAEHDLFVGKAYRAKYLTEGQILRIDCDIIDECSGVIVYDYGCISRGMEVEITHAIQRGIPVTYLCDEFCKSTLFQWLCMLNEFAD